MRRMSLFNLMVALALCVSLIQTAIGGLDDVVVVLVSQSNSYHASNAEHKAQQWRKEMKSPTEREPVIILSHKLQLEEAPWTVVPIFPHLSDYISTTSWFFFATEETDVNFKRLRKLLDSYDPQKELFLGHALEDSVATVLHHYMKPHSLSYPSFPSGWALSSPAMTKIIKHIRQFNPSFNIDPPYEMAHFFKYLRTVGVTELIPQPPPAPSDGILLTHVPQFCVSDVLKESSCATAYVQDIPNCESSLQLEDVFFAVKTCAKYHSTRLPVVQNTWGNEAAPGNIAYYSEIQDDTYSTTDIGVPNTERGHCGKCLAIIYKFYADHRDKKWLVIADDDTLLSVPRLLRLLRCYDSSRPILMGEAYGYFSHTPGGYTYVTGGGSMVLSRKAVISLVEAGMKCRSDDSPDDMFLGTIATHLDWDIVHSPLFHQAQPDSYHPSILKQQKQPVSFHKHSPRDPVTIYRELLVDGENEHHHEMYKDKSEL